MTPNLTRATDPWLALKLSLDCSVPKRRSPGWLSRPTEASVDARGMDQEKPSQGDNSRSS
jgi:hypothetical protein